MSEILVLDACALIAFFNMEAAHYKNTYKVSLADSIALGLARLHKAHLVTSDHHEFDPIEAAADAKFLWIR
jgi:PIN domain nuclease of toxin-antitoxin system